MMLREGINRVRDLFDTDTDRGQFGTGTTAEQFADTSLVSAVADTLGATTSTTASQFLIKTRELDSLEGNGNTLSEFELRENSSGNTIHRSTFTGIAKTNTIQLRTRTRYFFR
jgi:hypothetical protein